MKVMKGGFKKLQTAPRLLFDANRKVELTLIAVTTDERYKVNAVTEDWRGNMFIIEQSLMWRIPHVVKWSSAKTVPSTRIVCDATNKVLACPPKTRRCIRCFQRNNKLLKETDSNFLEHLSRLLGPIPSDTAGCSATSNPKHQNPTTRDWIQQSTTLSKTLHFVTLITTLIHTRYILFLNFAD